MKKITCIILTIAILFSVNPAISLHAVSGRDDLPVTTTAPYSGEYFVAVNATTNTTSTNINLSGINASLGGNLSLQTTMSVDSQAAINLNADGYSIQSKDKINGTDLYRVTPDKIINSANFSKSSVKTEGIQKNQFAVDAAYYVNQQKSFTVTDIYTNAPYTMTASMLASGSYCTIWADTAATGMTAAKAQQIATEYDAYMYSMMTSNFGSWNDADGDGKLAIVCYNIRDPFYYGVGNSYVAGYFYGGDMVPAVYGGNGNNMDMINVDIYPLMESLSVPDVTNSYGVVVHELQHMINFSDYWYSTQPETMDTWMNEAFSEAASYMYNPSYSQERINYYNEDPSSIIKNGRSAMDWQGDLENYSLSFLFGQYLRTQTIGKTGGGNQIFKTILADINANYWGIGNYTSAYLSMDFNTFMYNFRIALVAKNTSGSYGFNGDTYFDSLTIHTISASSVTLVGGGAVAVPITKATVTTPVNTGAFRFAGVGIPMAAAPMANRASGSFSSEFYVTLSTTQPDASIYYTLNGAPPTSNSTLYTTPIFIDRSTDLKAITICDNLKPSSVSLFNYNCTLAVVSTPFTFYSSGYYTETQQFYISTATTGADIYYTTDGSEPSKLTSAKYSPPLTITGNAVLKIIAAKNGMATSTTAIYNILFRPLTPTGNLASGTYNSDQMLTLSAADPTAEIYYTKDGSTPTNQSIKYINPISINRTTTIKAAAVKTGYIDSLVLTLKYKLPPVVITTAQQLSDIRNDLISNYILGNDIDLSGYNGGVWEPIGSIPNTANTAFSGTLDGDGYKITNLNSSGSSTTVGVFNTMYNATVKNLTIETVSGGITNTGYRTGLLASFISWSTITNCHVSGVLNLTAPSYHDFVNQVPASAGGLAGVIETTSTVTFCTSDVDISAINFSSIGGITGSVATSTISNCTTTGSIIGQITTDFGQINSNISIGGIAGITTYMYDINQCVSSVSMTVNTSPYIDVVYIGGILGRGIEYVVSDCLYKGNITATGFTSSGSAAIGQVGGVVGVFTNTGTNTVTNSYISPNANILSDFSVNAKGSRITTAQLIDPLFYQDTMHLVSGVDFLTGLSKGIVGFDFYPVLSGNDPVVVDISGKPHNWRTSSSYVAVPVPNLATGSYRFGQTITLASETSGAEFYYTTNGTTPTLSSTHYTGSFIIPQTKTLKAFSTKNGINSQVVTYTYTINNAPDIPTGLVTTEKTDTAVTLSWNASTGASGYNIYNGGVKVNIAPISKLYYTVIGLNPSTAYSFTVRSVNTYSVSSDSTALPVTTSATPTTGVIYTMDSPVGKAGQEITVAVRVNAGSNIGRGNFTLNYDSSILTFVSAQIGSALITDATNIITTPTEGTVLLSYVGKNGALITNAGTLMTVTFTIKTGTLEQTSPLVLETSNVSDLVNPITGTVIKAYASVRNRLKGDTNSDNDVNIVDVMLALRHSAGVITLSSEDSSCSDVNSDGEVNIVDVMLILRFSAGLISSF